MEPQMKVLCDALGYLYDRWQDEQEYEDWKDYCDAITKALPKGATAPKITQCPFGVTFNHGGKKYYAKATRTGMEWGTVADEPGDKQP